MLLGDANIVQSYEQSNLWQVLTVPRHYSSDVPCNNIENYSFSFMNQSIVGL